jgi:hypothetical protein
VLDVLRVDVDAPDVVALERLDHRAVDVVEGVLVVVRRGLGALPDPERPLEGRSRRRSR